MTKDDKAVLTTADFNDLDYATSVEAPQEPVSFDARGVPISEDHVRVWRRGIRKLDWRTVPPLGLLWLAAFIDRSNVGNAKVAGLTRDLKLVGNQFSVALAIFYVPYIAAEIPSNVALRKVGAKFWLPFLVFCWGVCTIGLTFVKNFGDLALIRVLLGLFEGGLLPGMPLYLSTMYPRHQVQVRIAYFYAGASLAGAFGGLLASGLLRMDGLGNLAGWRWIFALEGIATCLIAVLAWWWMPASIQSLKALSRDERDILLSALDWDTHSMRVKNSGVTNATVLSSSNRYDQGADFAHRLTADSKETKKIASDRSEKATMERSPAAAAATAAVTAPGFGVLDQEQFEWREIRRGLVDPQVWMTGIAYLCICNCLYSYTLFLPTILRGIYPDIGDTQLQLLTVPPFVPATIGVILVAYLSDRLQVRSPFVLGLVPLSIIGYIMLLATNNAKVKYAAVFLVALGVYPSIPCILAIPVNNTAGLYKRGAANALQLCIANLAGFVATFIYEAKWGPRYVQGHSVVLGSLIVAWILVAMNGLYCYRENAKRERGERDGNWAEYQRLVDAGLTKAPIGDRNPAFRFTI